MLRARESLMAVQLLIANAFWGQSASSGYYSMFYAASALLAGEGLGFSKHSAVIAAFGRHYARTGRIASEYHRYLKKAHELRILGDCGPFRHVTEQAAPEQVARAAEFVQMVEAMIGESGA